MKKIDDFINKIHHGDSLDLLKELPDESVDLIVTSPPYFGCRVYGDETLGREEHPLEYVNDIFKFTVEFKRVLKSSGSLYLNIGDVYFGSKGFSRNRGKWMRKTDHHYKEHKIVKPDGKYVQDKQLLLLPHRVAIKMQDDGWVLRNDIVWEKPNPIPSYAPDRRLPVKEAIFHFVKGKKYYFDYPLAKQENHHRDVIRNNVEPFENHQATFPQSLIIPLILTTSKDGDVVLDPFMGSGTVGVVCVQNNRNYIGFELNEDYCKDARKRIKNADRDFSKKPEDSDESSDPDDLSIMEL